MDYEMIKHSKPTLDSLEVDSIRDVILNGMIAQGEKVHQFETKMKDYIGRKYAIATNTGLSALHLSLIALGVSEGDEVIVPSYTCGALLHAITYVGAAPIVVDVDYETMNISLRIFRKAITARTKVAIIPHTYGFPIKGIDRFGDLGVNIIEDCATGVGGKYKNLRLGSFGRLSAFSFYATKMMTTGEGGMILTDEKFINDIAKNLRDYTHHSSYKVRYNYKMTDIAAVLGVAQLSKLDSFVGWRKVCYDEYVRLLRDAPGLTLPTYGGSEVPSYYRFVIKIKSGKATEFKEEMKGRGILCGDGISRPLHRMLGMPQNYPMTERIMKEAVSLPIYPTLSLGEVEYIAISTLKVLESLDG